MHNLKQIIRSVVLESFTDRPYGIAYTGAIVENESDVNRLKMVARESIRKYGRPDCFYWKVPENLHMTICLGELPLHRKMAGDLNSEVALHVTHIGFSELAVAFKVTGYMSKNDVQHITMRFKNQPSDSKDITNWLPLDEPFDVMAVIREVPATRAP